MGFKRGPKEQAVWDARLNRPAGVILAASKEASRCFAGIFNGCSSRGVIFKPDTDHLSIGKAECEWDWRKTWGELKSLGLIDWREEDVPCHDGRKMIYVHLSVTEKGHEVRDDDLAFFRQLMDARDVDDPL